MAGVGQMGAVLPKGSERRLDLRLLRAPPEGIEQPLGNQRLAAQLAPAFYLDVGNVCNQRCLYCGVDRRELYRTSLEQALAALDSGVGHGFETVALIGGEPTIWPHFPRLLAAMADHSLRRAILTTNGLMLAYPDFVTRLEAGKVAMVGLSLDDFDPNRQRLLAARPDNPELLAAALKNLARSQLDLYLYSVVTGLLSGRGGEHGRRFAALAQQPGRAPALILAGLKPVGRGIPGGDGLAISLEQSAAEVRAAIAAAGPDHTVACRDIPLCLLGEALPHSLDLCHQQAGLDIDRHELVPSPLAADRAFPPRCSECRLRPWCPALYRDYLEHYGEDELAPIA